MDVARFADSPVGQLVRIAGTDGRTGQDYEHVAFVPDPLDEEPALAGATWRQVARAGHALGRLQQAARQVPAPALLRRPTLRREAQSTSALEGTFAPLEDVLAGDLVGEPSRSAELREVLNYVTMADRGFTALQEGRRMTLALLCELHRLLVCGTAADNRQAGNVRDVQVALGSPGGGIVEARFVPPPPGLGLESAVQDLVRWVNESGSLRDPVVAAAMAHYQFETLHPFHDGNGRIGRLLVVLQLLREGVIDEPLLAVSPWFEQRQAEYRDHLAAVSAEGEWDGWIEFFARGLHDSALDTAHRVEELLQVQQRYLDRVRAADVTGAPRDVAELLVAYPYVTVRDVATRHERSFQTANKAVARLVDLGILRERTGRNYGRVFEASEVVRVLTHPI